MGPTLRFSLRRILSQQLGGAVNLSGCALVGRSSRVAALNVVGGSTMERYARPRARDLWCEAAGIEEVPCSGLSPKRLLDAGIRPAVRERVTGTGTIRSALPVTAVCRGWRRALCRRKIQQLTSVIKLPRASDTIPGQRVGTATARSDGSISVGQRKVTAPRRSRHDLRCEDHLSYGRPPESLVDRRGIWPTAVANLDQRRPSARYRVVRVPLGAGVYQVSILSGVSGMPFFNR
jgi:hypothetical protein